MRKVTGGIDTAQSITSQAKRRFGERPPQAMNRTTNHQALIRLIEAVGHAPNPTTQIKLRRAAYLHAIVEAMLAERVDALPEAYPVAN